MIYCAYPHAPITRIRAQFRVRTATPIQPQYHTPAYRAQPGETYACIRHLGLAMDVAFNTFGRTLIIDQEIH